MPPVPRLASTSASQPWDLSPTSQHQLYLCGWQPGICFGISRLITSNSLSATLHFLAAPAASLWADPVILPCLLQWTSPFLTVSWAMTIDISRSCRLEPHPVNEMSFLLSLCILDCSQNNLSVVCYSCPTLTDLPDSFLPTAQPGKGFIPFHPHFLRNS